MVDDHIIYLCYTDSIDALILELLLKCEVNVEDSKKKINELHIQEISINSCSDWKCLRPHLSINKTVVDDISKNHTEERYRRQDFFATWVEQNGSNATYYKLIEALLNANKKEYAEFVCKLLQKERVALPLSENNKQSTQVSDSSLPGNLSLSSSGYVSSVLKAIHV